MTLEALKKQLNEGTVEGIYYLFGDEQYLIDYYYNKFKEICAPIMAEFNLIELDGKKLDFDFLGDAAASYPVMAEKKLVMIEDPDLNAMKGNGEKKILAALGDIAPGVTILFWEHAKEKGKSTAQEALMKKLGGNAVKIDRPKAEALVNWVIQSVKKAGSAISNVDAAYLAELTGNSMLRLNGEVHKLTAYAGKEIIDREMIDRMVAPEEGASWFAISNALANHDFDEMMQVLHTLYALNTDDTVIAGMFYRAYIDLWRGETALREGKSAAELASVCGISPYAAGNMMRSASRLKEGETLYGLRKCNELDQKIKTSGLNKKDLIYSFAASLLAFQMKEHEEDTN